MPDDTSSLNLVQRVKALEDSMQMHRHTGFDNSQQLSGTPISHARLLDAVTLGDGVGKSGTLTLKYASGYGSPQIRANLTAGDFANAGALTGFIMGIDDSDSGKVKFYFGSSTNYIKYDGSTLKIVGNLTASSIDIPDTTTASSFHVDSSGNAWWGATTLASALASVSAAGVATFAGLSVINKKAFTNFETAARFLSTQTGSAAAPVFANQGVTIAPSATATSSSVLRWQIGNALTNNPTFTCTIVANSLHAASGTGRGFIGLGQPTVAGGGITFSGNSQIGIRIQKDAGVVTISSETNDGGSGTSQGAAMTTIVDGDVIEIFVHVVSSVKVQWYYRKNGGAITLGDTQTTHIPTGSSEDSVTFSVSNAGTAADFSLIIQCAAYEH